MKPPLIFSARIVEADDVGAGRLGLGIRALREDRHATFCPGAAREHHAAAHHWSDFASMPRFTATSTDSSNLAVRIS
jgi:hypothetical protein